MTAPTIAPVLSGNGNDEDDLVHVVCVCEPRTIDGQVLALCGTTVDDGPDETGGSSSMDCIVCAELETVPGSCRSCRL